MCDTRASIVAFAWRRFTPGWPSGAASFPFSSPGAAWSALRDDANLFFAWLDEFEPTFYMAVPAFHRAVLDEGERRGGMPRSTLRFIGSESVALPRMERRLEGTFGVPVVQGYGLTETGLIAQTPLPPGHRRAGSVGIAVDSEISVLDGDRRRTLPSDQPGEIVVRGAAVFGGYEDNPEANREAFHDGWFRTGDLGYVDRDGYLFIVGRVKEIINRGGTKVSPTAVDAVLLGHPAVRDAGTFPVPHPTLGQDVVTAVVLHDWRAVDTAGVARLRIRAPFRFCGSEPGGAGGQPAADPLGKLKRDELSRGLLSAAACRVRSTA